jgi:predicted transcriptional regulator
LDLQPEILVAQQTTPAKKAAAQPSAADWSIADAGATQILRNWYNVPILELLTLANFDGTAAAISRRLGLSKTTTEVALRELEMIGLIKNKKGRFVKTESRLRFTSSKSTTLIRKFHDEMLEKSQLELRNANS